MLLFGLGTAPAAASPEFHGVRRGAGLPQRAGFRSASSDDTSGHVCRDRRVAHGSAEHSGLARDGLAAIRLRALLECEEPVEAGCNDVTRNRRGDCNKQEQSMNLICVQSHRLRRAIASFTIPRVSVASHALGPRGT